MLPVSPLPVAALLALVVLPMVVLGMIRSPVSAGPPGSAVVAGEPDASVPPASRVNDAGPPAPRSFPAGYGPRPKACFSPYRLPVEALAAGPSGPDGAATGDDPASGPDGAATGDDPASRPSGGGLPPVSYLCLNVAARQLYVYGGGTLAAVYPTAVGAIDHHTPIGRYPINSKHMFPTWYPPDGSDPVPPGPGNPLGTRWMGFSTSGFGLHGTNALSSIGRAVSLGCVRLSNANAETLFDAVQVGTPLDIVYEPVEIAAGQDGFVLSLYPDIYSRLGNYEAFLRERLSLAGVSVSEDLLAGLMEALGRHGSVTFDTLSEVAVDARCLDAFLVRFGGASSGAGVPRVSVRTFAEASGLYVGWDPVLGQGTMGGRPIEGITFLGHTYASGEDLQRTIGGGLDWTWTMLSSNSGDNLVRGRLDLFSTGAVYVNQLLITRQAFAAQDGIYIPLRSVALALGLAVCWDPASGSVFLDGIAIEVQILEGTSYVRTDTLESALSGRATISVTAAGIHISF